GAGYVGGEGVGGGARVAHGRQDREQRRIADVADDGGEHRVARLVGGSGAEGGNPARDGLCAVVLVGIRRVVGGEAGGVVDRRDVDDERLRRRGVVAAVGGAAVVLGDDGDGGAA